MFTKTLLHEVFFLLNLSADIPGLAEMIYQGAEMEYQRTEMLYQRIDMIYQRTDMIKR